jgi:HK97 family phage prohead protease
MSETRTIDVNVENLDTRGKVIHGYAAVYNTLSEDLGGGRRERIAPGAFAGVVGGDVRALLNHDPNEVLGRTKSGTLRLFDEPRGLRFELDLPDSPLGENMRSAVKRGDIDGASFQFEVGDESWDGDVRTVQTIKALHDVTLATYPAYPAASIELRTKETKTMEDETKVEGETEVSSVEPEAEQRTRTTQTSTGTFRVTERDQAGTEQRTLWGKYLSAGFQPGGQRTELTWTEYGQAWENRAITMGTTTLDLYSGPQFAAAPFPYDTRWAWPAFQQVPVDAATTAVNILAETSRTLISGGTAVRAINATSSKPEVALTVTNTPTELKQIAAVVAGIPNIVLKQNGIESIIANDLRLSYADGLDFHVCQGINTAGTQTLATDPLLNVIRRSITVLRSSGFNPDTLLLTPANSETLDLFTTGGTAGWPGAYAFGAGQFGPSRVFGLQTRVSKSIGQPVVLDSVAFGKVYASPVSLASFEEAAGLTNTSLVRFEGNAVLGIERLTAAVRIT